MYYKENWYDKLARKYGRYSISNLMYIIVIGMGIVFLADMFLYPVTHLSLSSFLAFDRQQIMHGQFWRLISFIFIPPDSSILFIVFSLYLYWLIGSSLESQWGSFRFNLFYFTGVLGTLIAGLITGYATNSYLNLSLYLAFALLYPDYQLMLFFFLPVKIKYLALLDLIGLLILFISGTWGVRISLLISLANIIIFFWHDFIDLFRNAKRRHDFRKASGYYRK